VLAGASGDNGDKTCGPTADERCCRSADGSEHREGTPSATTFWSRTAVHSHLGYERSRDREFVDVEASATESPRVHARVSQIRSCGSMRLDGHLACFAPPARNAGEDERVSKPFARLCGVPHLLLSAEPI
jgi:hypothetical protein